MFGVNVDKALKPGRSDSGPRVVAIRKPELRGTLLRLLRYKLIGGAALVFSAAIAWRVGVCEARKNKYLDFYNNYDGRADFQRMVRVGVFQSINKDGTFRRS